MPHEGRRTANVCHGQPCGATARACWDVYFERNVQFVEQRVICSFCCRLNCLHVADLIQPIHKFVAAQLVSLTLTRWMLLECFCCKIFDVFRAHVCGRQLNRNHAFHLVHVMSETCFALKNQQVSARGSFQEMWLKLYFQVYIETKTMFVGLSCQQSISQNLIRNFFSRQCYICWQSVLFQKLSHCFEWHGWQKVATSESLERF